MFSLYYNRPSIRFKQNKAHTAGSEVLSTNAALSGSQPRSSNNQPVGTAIELFWLTGLNNIT
jgi:hypothetical protein